MLRCVLIIFFVLISSHCGNHIAHEQRVDIWDTESPRIAVVMGDATWADGIFLELDLPFLATKYILLFLCSAAILDTSEPE